MALIDEIQDDIKSQRKSAPEGQAPAEPKKKRHRRTKAEMEAYRQKKIAEEEARYLAMQNSGKPNAGAKQRTKKAPQKAASKQSAPVGIQNTVPLSPLTPLYTLKIPNLPKGDCLVICYGRGMAKEPKPTP